MPFPETDSQLTGWFRANAPRDWHTRVEYMDSQEYEHFQRQWLRRLNSCGFAAPGVAREWGGGGYGVREQAAIFRAWARSGAPPVDLFEVSLNHVPHTLLAAGTRQQQQRYIRAAIQGTVWCQGFSEPDAGSDLAGMQTRAARDVHDWVVTGQKTWSSHADHARHCLLLARTDPASRGRSGLTYFVMGMDSPGVTVRPIRQIHGPAGFCEIFLDGVRIPPENVIGTEHEGWQAAQATLAAERGPMLLPMIERIGVALQELAHHHAGRCATVDGAQQAVRAIERELAGLLARHAAVRSLALDTVELIERKREARGLVSPLKVAFSELLQDVTGYAARLNEEQTLLDAGTRHFLGYVSGRWMTDWLGSWAATIAGGANEIQRTIIAERLLGLPRGTQIGSGGAR